LHLYPPTLKKVPPPMITGKIQPAKISEIINDIVLMHQ